MTDPLTILCATCHQPLERFDAVDQSEHGPRQDYYQCSRDGCTGGKLAVLFELSGEHAPIEPGFVQREVARRGAFWPSDLAGSGGFRGGGGRGW